MDTNQQQVYNVLGFEDDINIYLSTNTFVNPRTHSCDNA